MKFTAATFTLAGLVALAAAAPQAETTSAPTDAPAVTSAPSTSYSVSVDPVYSSVLACISKCPAGDVICQAKCQGLPVPDETAVNRTHDCIAACPPGGDDEKNAAWAVCQQNCVTSLYWTASITWTGSVALPTGDDAEPTDGNSNGGDPSATGEDGAQETGGNSENPSQTSGGSNPSQTPNAASSMFVNIPLLGALFLGALAL